MAIINSMNVISIYGNHDANITVMVDGKYRIYELERLMKERYFTLNTYKDYKYIYDTIAELIKKEFDTNVFDEMILKDVPKDHVHYLSKLFKVYSLADGEHHLDHATGGFWLSGFDEAIVVSFDDGGWDKGEVSYFNIYHADKDSIRRIKKIDNCKPGSGYNLLSIPLSEVSKTNDGKWGNRILAFAGKKMGLTAYGQLRPDWLEPIKNFYKTAHGTKPATLKQLKLDVPLGINTLKELDSYDLAHTSQYVFEQVVYEHIINTIKEYDLPVVLTGGCALNVLFNEFLRKRISNEVYIQPNPNDCGLSFGSIVRLHPPTEKPVITYSGFQILDLNKLYDYVVEREAGTWDYNKLAKLIHEGNIIGVLIGDSEVGPRALGNRSIICDPSYPDMKDTLNENVKFREWYRPYAPVVRYEDREEIFEFNGNSPYMSFCPKIKRNMGYPAITHIDNTSRLQTVKREDHEFFYDIITHMDKLFNKKVILNTSFNIKGMPILTTIEDAMHVLDVTEMDYLIVEDYIFEKYNGDKTYR